ncbi:unnamed protein product [Sphagnum compactum]
MQVSGFLIDKETKDYKGIETASGQHLYSGKLITGPSFCLRSVSSTSTEDRDNGEETAHHSFSESTSTTTDSANKVARCICITDQSLQPGVFILEQHWWCEPCSWGRGLKFVPMANHDYSLGQLGQFPNLFVFVVVDDAIPHMPSIFKVQWTPENVNCRNRRGDVGMCCMPDGTLDYRTMMAQTETIFHKLFPEQEFLPRVVVAANNVEDGEADDVDGVNSV